jgi:hypothetical protein
MVMANIDGTSSRDILSGSSHDDVIHGFEGADTLDGAGGDDDLFGEENNDILVISGGNDRFFGGSGQRSDEWLRSAPATAAEKAQQAGAIAPSHPSVMTEFE